MNWRLVARPLNLADLLDMRGDPGSWGSFPAAPVATGLLAGDGAA